MGKRKAEAPQCSETERDVLYRSWRQRLRRNSQKWEKKTGKTYGTCRAMLQTSNMASRKCLHNRRLYPRRLQTIYGCIVEADNPTNQRVESSQPKNHGDHIAGKRFTSMTHFILVHKFIPMHQAMKIPVAKAAVDGEREKARDDPSLAVGQSQEQKGGYPGSTKRQKRKSTLPHWWTCVISRMRELEPTLHKYKSSVVLRGDIVKDDSGAYAFFSEQSSSASQMPGAKEIDVTARLPDCDGQAADAVSAYSSKDGGCSLLCQNVQTNGTT